MIKTKLFSTTLYLMIFLFSNSCATGQTQEPSQIKGVRQLSQATEFSVRLVPQEAYGEEVLDLLNRRSQDGIAILQFSFFTDNKEDSYPKKIAQRLIDIRQQYPNAPITVALESKKDADDPGGKGVAQRNLKTKKWLTAAGIEVHDVYGHSRNLQSPAGKKDGVSHTKLVMAGNEVIAGSNNLSKQSTDVEANNEMNVAIQSDKIANAVRDYVAKIIATPGQMVDVEVEDGNVRLLTDRLHFDELIGQIRKGQKGDQIGLSMYQFLYRNERDPQARQVLEELLAAHKRGVQLEIFLNRAEDLSTQNTAANLLVAERLIQEGVTKVYLDPGAKISHSKFLYRLGSSEKVAMISSVNIYRGDFNDNHQLTWVIKDGVVPEQLVSYFKQQIAYDGVLLSRISKDPVTGLRYRETKASAEEAALNQAMPAQHMLRFWRGFKQEDVPRNEFESNVNTRLIPETIEVGARRGLMAYLPSFFSEGKPDFLPDEVAIVDYADEESYNAIRTTERGKKYGPLHFETGLFAKQDSKGFRSGSLVAINYADVVEIRPEGQAYILGKSDLNWQQGVSLRRTVLPIGNMTASDVQLYLSRFQENLDRFKVSGAVVIVDPRYILMMINAIDQQAAQSLDMALGALEAGRFKKYDHLVFETQKQGATRLPSGSGINVKFEAETMPRIELMETVLKNIRGSRPEGAGL